jgi:hypothetical protein
MRKKFYNDSIGIEIEIDEENKTLKSIEIKEVDTDVFPPLAVDDKVKMSWFVDMITRAIQSILSDRRWQQQASGAIIQQGEDKKIHKCEKCGKEFEVETPCCGVKVTREICPGCHQLIVIRWE